MKRTLAALAAAAAILLLFIFSKPLNAPLRFTWHSNAAQYYEAKGRYKEAIHEYHEAARIYRSTQIRKHLLKVYRKDFKRFEERAEEMRGPAGRKETVDEIIRESPENPQAHILLASWHFSRLELPEAEAAMDRAVKLNPEIADSLALQRVRVEYECRRNISEAMRLLDEMIKGNVRTLDSRSQVIKMYVLGGAAAGKRRELQYYVLKNRKTRNPNRMEALGYAHLGLGEYMYASESFGKALKSRSASTDVFLGLRMAEAGMLLLRAQQIGRIQPDVTRDLASRAVALDPGSWRRAAELVEKYRLLPVPPKMYPGLHYAMARRLAADGRPGAAIGEYRAALAVDPTHMESTAGLIDAYEKLNDKRGADAARKAARRFQTRDIPPAKFLGAARGNLYWSGSIVIGDVRLLSGGVEFQVQARGTPAAGIYPAMGLFLDGKYVGAAEVGRKPLWHRFRTKVETGTHVVEIRFANDAKMGKEDRNLFVTRLKIRGL